MDLAEYIKKRDFKKTPEPKGKSKRSKFRKFVIHKHWARRLHYDLRLEVDGVLKSWALPKGPSLIGAEKRLAVNVEDHPLAYSEFEGIIPEGQYGAGKVTIWDRGEWNPLENNFSESYKKGKLTFFLHGEILKGEWSLIRMKDKQWLLIKKADDFAFIDPSKIKKAVKVKMPEVLNPQLATLVKKAPVGPNWIYETKFDGYRLVSYVNKGKVRLITRGGHDWTEKFPKIAKACSELPIQNGIFDGELTVVNNKGLTDFQALQNAIHENNQEVLRYYLFDLPYCNGFNLTKAPLGERKKLLFKILKLRENSRFLHYSEHIEGDIDLIFKKACELSLEGLIGKDKNSPYSQKRSDTWIKIKCSNEQDFVIGGYTEPNGARKWIGALLLGLEKNGKFIFCGKVGTGFDEKKLHDLYSKFKRIEVSKSPFDNYKKSKEKVHWLKPEYKASIKFAGWTEDSKLRQAAFVGLRDEEI